MEGGHGRGHVRVSVRRRIELEDRRRAVEEGMVGGEEDLAVGHDGPRHIIGSEPVGDGGAGRPRVGRWGVERRVAVGAEEEGAPIGQQEGRAEFVAQFTFAEQARRVLASRVLASTHLSWDGLSWDVMYRCASNFPSEMLAKMS